MVHLAFLVGKLAGAEARILVDHHRRLHFLVAGCSVIVEEEVDERALEFRSLVLIDGETGSGDLHAEVEVYDVVFLCEFPVRKRVLREDDLGAAHLDHLVVLGALTGLHEVAGHVGHEHEVFLEFLFGCVHLRKEFSGLGLESRHLGLDLLGGIAEALLHQAADLRSLLLLLSEQGVALGLEGATLPVELEDGVHEFLCIEILYLQFLDNRLGVVTESLECKHISGLLTAVLKIKGLHFSRSVRPFYLLVLRD